MTQLPQYWIESAALLAALGTVAVIGGLLRIFRVSSTQKRLGRYVGGKARSTGSPLRNVRLNPGEWAAWLSRRALQQLLPRNSLNETRTLLILAGNPPGKGLEEFIGARIMLALLLAALAVLAFNSSEIPEMIPVVALACAAIGYTLPMLLLKRRIAQRRIEILRAMPNALDLLSVSVEAGLGLDQALMEVCTKWQNPLTQEFTTMLIELKLGSNRREALRGLTRRTGVQELNAFASALIQSDELGTSISRTLAVQAELIRTRRRQLVQELAHQAGVKMSFPLVFLMMPALFVVIIGPAIPNLIGAFAQSPK